MLEIRLLGQIALTVDGRPLTIASRPARLLLAYVLLNQTLHPREYLAELLWPDSTPDNARSNLRHALWRLRTDLAGCGCESTLLIITEQDIGLDVDCPLWFDVAVLESPISGDTPLELIESQLCVYRGELLPGYFDSWIMLERERLKAILGLRMGVLLERLADVGNWPAVIAWAEQWIALDELPEAAYRYLMLAHGQQGDAGLAGLAYRRCRHVLAEEFDAEPSSATRALAAALQENAIGPIAPLPPAHRAAAALPGSVAPLPWPVAARPHAGELSRQMRQLRLLTAQLRRDLWLALAAMGTLMALGQWRRKRRP